MLSGSTVEASHAAGGIAGDVGISVGGYPDGTTTITDCNTYATLTGNASFKGGVAGSVTDASRANFSGNTWPSEYPAIGDGSALPVEPQPDNPTTQPDTTSQDVHSELPEGIIHPVSLEPQVLEAIAQTLSTDPSQIHELSEANISAPKEPTQEITDYVKSDGYEINGKLSTISANTQGYYVFKITLTDELYQLLGTQSVSDFKFYALSSKDHAGVSVSLLSGLLSTWELFTLNGDKLDSFGTKEFLMVGFLDAGTPFSVYLAKIIIALLAGGCNTGIFTGSLAVILLIIKFRKH
ncbi:MAG: hypothetical protein IJR85_07650 [Synergistaceae bacterium]|nr:hypothetical protein [Synergistaceae bacterium]